MAASPERCACAQRLLFCMEPTVSTETHASAARRTPLFRSLLVVALAVLLSACGQPPPQQTLPPAEVSALEVQPRDLPLQLDYAAQLRGMREVEVRARVSGILLERRYDEGAAVKAGDVLFRIDPAPFRAEADRARAELGVQQANLQQARRERDRILPLYDQKLASLRDRDTAVAAFESAQAAVAAAEAAMKSADLNLSYTDVRAPIAGLTSREVRSEGSLVTAGDDSSLLTYIVQSGSAVRRSRAAGGRRGARARGARRTARRGHGPSRRRARRCRGARRHASSSSRRAWTTRHGTVAVRAVLDNGNGRAAARARRARARRRRERAELARDSEARGACTARKARSCG